MLYLLLLIPALVAAKAAPQTIQLQSRTAPVERTLRRRSLKPVTVPLADFFLGTDLQCAFHPSGVPAFNQPPRWFGNISVGTPPQVRQLIHVGYLCLPGISSATQTISVVFDTGSNTLEFASTLCGSPCDNQVKFNPTESSTFVDGNRTGCGSYPTI
jgi:hypothetical protein